MFKTLFFSIWLLFHPVHVTLTSIDYVPKMGSFKVFVRMNFDDFLLDCKLNGDNILNKKFSVNDSLSKDIMEKYLGEKIIITVNEKPLSGELKDINLIDNEISINLMYSTMKKPKTITVKNLIMTGLYKDQSNMIILKIDDFEEGVKLTADKTEQTFTIK
jgi:hypothetical protein